MDPSIYRVLKVEPDTKTNANIDVQVLIDAMEETHETCQFSTIPYYRHNTLSSLFALKYYHSGNCIAMSMCAQNILRAKYNIYSFLIPASIPEIFVRPGYLYISHVALCVPDRKKGYYILDLAFYFLKPIYICNDTLSKRKVGTCINIYNSNKIEKIEYTAHRLHHDNIINEYQMIPKHTVICSAHFDYNENDMWNYYIIKVLHPDDSIGRTFLNTRNDNFLTVTDKYSKLLLYIKQPYQFKHNVVIKYQNNELFNGIFHLINNTLLTKINKDVQLFLPYGLINALL